MSIVDQVTTLSSKDRLRFFQLLSNGICLHARGLATDIKKSSESRLLQADAIIEMLHRIFEQSEHYYLADGFQRSEADLFMGLETMEKAAGLHGLISSASQYALSKTTARQ